MDIFLLVIIVFLLLIIVVVVKRSGGGYGQNAPLALQRKLQSRARVVDKMIAEAKARLDSKDKKDQTKDLGGHDWDHTFWTLTQSGNCFKKKAFMTDRELIFFNRLIFEYGHSYSIHCQVDLGALVDTGYRFSPQSRENRMLFGIIKRFRVDFVLYSRISKDIVAVIELDDASHLLPERVERDKKLEEVLKQANIPLFRFNNPKEDLSII